MRCFVAVRRSAWASALVIASSFPLCAVHAQAPLPTKAVPAARKAQTSAPAACAASGDDCQANGASPPTAPMLRGSAEFLGVCAINGNALEPSLKLLCSKVYGPLNA